MAPQRPDAPLPNMRRYHPVRTAFRFILILIMILIIAGCVTASIMTVYIINTLDSSDSIVLEDVKLSFSTIIYAQDKESGEYKEIQTVQSDENRIWASYDEIPQAMKDAAVAVEDKRFWKHSGIDFRRTIGAAINYLNPFSSESYGGSTITQQVVKNVTNDRDDSVERKVREIFRAINLEKNYSKDQILEVYLNTIALGNGQNGVGSAAQFYFGKNISDLTPAECASIIAITQNPSKWDPFRHPENNKDRREDVLYFMSQQSRPDGTPMLSQEEYEDALSQTLDFKAEEYKEQLDVVQSWFIDTVYEEVLNDLVEKANYTKAGAWDALKSGGFRIYTTMDIELQDYLEEVYTKPETFPPVRNAVYPESAFVILGDGGEIKAIVGSNREKEGARLFNRATSAVRHPGSTIKPLASYAPALDSDLIYWSMIWEDSPIQLDPHNPNSLYPVNFYHSYLGNITITEAIQRSTNTIPVKLVQLLTPRVSFNFLRDKLGFKSLVEQEIINGQVFSDVDLAPMALGAMTGGVTPLEMAGGYQIFSNGGLYYEPHSYTKVLDSEGNVILDNKIIPQRAISPETAGVMNKLLQQVTNSAPGTGVRAKLSNFPVAGKTGTSDNDYNQWFIGVTPYYVGVCWLGYDEMETINYSGLVYPPPTIWKNVMQPIHNKLPPKDFTFSGDIVQKIYCRESGLLAGPECTQTAYGWYKASSLPPECTKHGGESDMPQNSGDHWDWFFGDDDEDD